MLIVYRWLCEPDETFHQCPASYESLVLPAVKANAVDIIKVKLISDEVKAEFLPMLLADIDGPLTINAMWRAVIIYPDFIIKHSEFYIAVCTPLLKCG